MHAEFITKRWELDALSEEWNTLLASSEADTIFLTWEWISAWLDVVWPDVQLLVVALRDRNGDLAAVAPYYYERMRFVGLVDYRCLRLLGDVQSGAEYPDVIIRSGHEMEAIPVLRAALRERRHTWDCLWIPAAAGWTGALPRHQELCAGGEFHLHVRRHPFSAIELPDTHDAYLESLSANARSSIRRSSKRLFALRRVELTRCEARDGLSRSLSRLYHLHQRRWSALGQAGSFVRWPRMRLFYDRFAPVAMERGWLRLYALEVDGAVQAVQYGYAYNGRFHQLQEGFEPEAADGIGNVLRHLVFEACIDEALQEYDFLGGFTEHKRRWGAKRRFGYDIFIGRRTFKNRALFTKEIWPTGRYVTEGGPPPLERAATAVH